MKSPKKSKMKGEKRRDATAADHGTAERWSKAGRIELEETIQAGVSRARVKYECLLDVLRDRGDLGEGATGDRRYDAGLWLRQLYQRTHDAPVVWRYETVGRDQSEMSDAQAAAHGHYRRALLALGPEFAVLRQVCCNDRPGRLSLLTRALDRLAAWRGM